MSDIQRLDVPGTGLDDFFRSGLPTGLLSALAGFERGSKNGKTNLGTGGGELFLSMPL